MATMEPEPEPELKELESKPQPEPEPKREMEAEPDARTVVVHTAFTAPEGQRGQVMDLAVGDAILFTAGGDHVYGSPDEAGGRGTLLVIHTRD